MAYTQKVKSSRKTKTKSQPEVQPDKITLALLIFEETIAKCLADKHPVLDEYSVALVRKTRKDGKIERLYRYSANFKYGAFYTEVLKLRHDYFRPLNEQELVNLIFNRLSSCNDFEFNFKKQQFSKRRILMG